MDDSTAEPPRRPRPAGTAADGDPAGAVASGRELLERGLTEAARDRLAAPAEQGDPQAALLLGSAHCDLGRPDLAEPWLRRAAAAGVAEARAPLGYLLLDRGEPEEAEPFLRGEEATDPAAAQIVATLLQAAGHSAAADRLRGRSEPDGGAAAEASGPAGHAATARAVESLNAGDTAGAERWCRLAAEHGDAAAAALLVRLLHAEGRAAEAEAWHRGGAELGDEADPAP